MKKLLLPLLLIVILVPGCTVESNRIYNVCKVSTDGTVYCYDDLGKFYVVYNDNVLPISGVGLYTYPTLKLIPTTGDYTFTKDIPGKYAGSLRDVNHYVYKLLSELSNVSIVTNSVDCYIMDITVNADEGITRIIFNKSGSVRIYYTDNSGNAEEPLYINK